MALQPTNPISVQDVSSWLVIKWSSILKLDLPAWVIKALEVLFPNNTNITSEGIVIELGSLVFDYRLSEIPTATATAAPGFNMRNPKAVSAIHFILDSLKLFVSASIYVFVNRTYISGNAFYTNQWPKTPFRVFDGHIIGSSYRKSFGNVELNLQLVNWLSDLSFSSSLSRSSSPTNPGDISFDNGLPLFDNAGGLLPSAPKVPLPLLQLQGIITNSIVVTDIWGGIKDPPKDEIPPDLPPPSLKDTEGTAGMKKWLTELCKKDRINWKQFQLGLCLQGPPIPGIEKNIEALTAISKFEPLTYVTPEESKSNVYIDGVPVALIQQQGTQNIAAQISTALGHQMPQVLATHTIWDKLVGEFCGQLQLAVVPQVEKALLVPFNPGLRKPWTTIWASEFDFFEESHNIPRPIRGVAMFVGREMTSGGQGNRQPIFNLVGASYENPERKQGMMIFKQLPMWLSTVVLPFNDGAAGQDRRISVANDPGSGDSPLVTKPPKDRIEDMKDFWCKYARGLYIQEILRGRSARLSGRLRFDIAPGSIIKIEVPEESFVRQRMGTKQTFAYAQVIGVSYSISSEQQRAGTAYQLAFLRDEAENIDDSYSVAGHPLWKNNWSGAPLVNQKEFYYGTLKDT